MLRPPASSHNPCVVGLHKDTSSHLQPTGGLHSSVVTMNKSVHTRRVIFPSLYQLAPTASPSPSLPAIPEDSGRTSLCELPPLGKEEAARLREELQHLLTLSPLNSRTTRTVPATDLGGLPSLPCFERKSNKTKAEASPGRAASREDTDICLSPPQLSLERKLKQVRSEVKRNRELPALPRIMLDLQKPNPLPREPAPLPSPVLKPRTILPSQVTPLLRRISPEESPELTPKKIVQPPVPSILRRSKSWSKTAQVEKVSSVSSDLPSLASSETQSSLSEAGEDDEDDGGVLASPPRRHRSEPTFSMSRGISFDPHVWVREFERSETERKAIWYTPQEMGSFKTEALNRVLTYESSDFIPTGTGRTIRRPLLPPKTAFFSHPSLSVDGNERLAEKDTTRCRYREAVLENEVRRILVVDPHDIILKLFSKTLRIAMPMVSVTTATSSEEAIRHVLKSKKRFDIVIVEERLGLFRRQHHSLASGSNLIKRLVANDTSKKSLYVGVSTQLHQDEAKLRAGGADLCWPKPPPPLDQNLLDEILRLLLKKRGRTSAAKELFGG